MELKNEIFSVGVCDNAIDLFEGQYIVPDGIRYNSYVVIDEKIAVFDTVDQNFGDEWLNNVNSVLEGKIPDYLIVQHVEPDHSANVDKFLTTYPNCTVVATAKAFSMMKNFFGKDYLNRRIIVSDNDTLSIGKHIFTFITAPMVHWPEVMLTYDAYAKCLFSADAFGKFGVSETDDDWACEARRYYFGIVGKFGAQVQSLLKKVSNLEIEAIYPLHGPCLTENLSYYINLYDVWSSYAAESQGVAIFYTSVYGNTKKAVEILAEELKNKGVKVVISDLARDDTAEAVEDAFKYGKIVLATTTYNGSIFPFMNNFIETLVEHNYQNRIIGFIENGSWMPLATKIMKSKLECCKNITFIENGVKIVSALNQKNIDEIVSLANELAK